MADRTRARAADGGFRQGRVQQRTAAASCCGDPHRAAALRQGDLPNADGAHAKGDAELRGLHQITKIGKPGLYTINLSANGWIDAIQNGAYRKTIAFSGVTGCEGMRKSVKFELGDTPLILQVSGVPSDSIALVVAPVSE